MVELVFSFVDADPKRGIPLDDWMAFLAASGLNIPEELHEVKVDVNGTIAILEDTIEQGEPVSITVSFNVEIVAYEFLLFVEGSSEAVDNRLIQTRTWTDPILMNLKSKLIRRAPIRLNFDISVFVLTHKSLLFWHDLNPFTKNPKKQR